MARKKSFHIGSPWLKSLILTSFFIAPVYLHAQERTVKGTVTFITSEFVYTTLGRNANIQDSSHLAVVSRGDTIATLKVIATSSKSSACSILSARKPPAVGDTVVGYVPQQEIAHVDSTVGLKSDSTLNKKGNPPTLNTQHQDMNQVSPWLKLQGRVSLQNLTFIYTDPNFNQSEPGMSVNLNGRFNGSNLSFQIAGTFRTLIRNKDFFSSASSANQTRVYRLSLDYDDGTNAFSLGRIVPVYAPLIGSVDGALYAHTFDLLTIGVAGGFEPSYIPGFTFTDLRKFSIFGSVRSADHKTFQGSVVYSQSFYRSEQTRNVVGGSLLFAATDRLFFSAQGEVDLRTKLDTNLDGKAKLTSLNASMNYSIIREISVGIGVSAWRPTYFYEVIQPLPAEFLDTRLRTNPFLSLSLNLPGGLSAMNSFSPRSSDLGFGKEYSNTSSLGWSDTRYTGIFYRANYTVNTTALSTVRGYTITAQRSISSSVNLNLRYQTNRFDLPSFKEVTTSHALALDFLVGIVSHLSLWFSAERDYGTTVPYTSLLSELSYRF